MRTLPELIYLWDLKKNKKSNQKVQRNGCVVNNAFLSFLVKFFLKKEKKSKKDNMANLLHKITFCV